MKATCLLFLLALLISQVLCDVYLSPNGDDQNGDGSEKSPFQTLSKALNSTSDSEDELNLYFYPGIYGGPENVGLNYTGAINLNFMQNSTDTTLILVEFDCTNATGIACLSSNTGITISPEDGNFLFQDCGVCLSINRTDSDEISDDNVLDIEGTDFIKVTQYAIYASYIDSASIDDCLFTDDGADGLTLVLLSNVQNEIDIESSNFTSSGKNALSIVNTTITEIDECSFTGSKVFIQGSDKESQVEIDDSTFFDNVGFADYTVLLQTGTFVVKDNKFTSNNSGGMKIVDSIQTSLLNCSFSLGSADNGGALYLQNITTATISDECIFTMNTAANSGGAIYLDDVQLNIETTNFTGNIAPYGVSIGCSGLNKTQVYYDNSTATDTGNYTNDIQDTCQAVNQKFDSSLVQSSIDDGGSNAWIWILVSIAIVLVVLIIIGAVGFVIYQRKRQSYTRVD